MTQKSLNLNGLRIAFVEKRILEEGTFYQVCGEYVYGDHSFDERLPMGSEDEEIAKVMADSVNQLVNALARSDREYDLTRYEEVHDHRVNDAIDNTACARAELAVERGYTSEHYGNFREGWQLINGDIAAFENALGRYLTPDETAEAHDAFKDAFIEATA